MADLFPNPPEPPRRKSGRKPGLQPEERFQIALIHRFHDILPRDCMVWAIEQGLLLAGKTKEARMRAWQRLVNKGVRSGVVDLHFAWHKIYAVIELKWGKNKVTDAEHRFMNDLRCNGFYAAAAWTAAEVQVHLAKAGIPLQGTLMDLDEKLAQTIPPKPKKPSKPRAARPERRALNALARARKGGVFV